jgi:hypothetical protein
MRSWRVALALAMVAGLIFCATSGLGGDGLLSLAPALALAATLFVHRYPGERLLLRLARRPSNARRPCAATSACKFRLGMALVPRGGQLMGRSLAVRPPPASFAAS